MKYEYLSISYEYGGGDHYEVLLPEGGAEEFDVEEYTNMVNILTKFGNDGWELVSTIFADGTEIHYLKREKKA